MWRGRCHFVVAVASWPDLAQPSTTLPFPASPVVDGRHKAGHDTVGTPARYFNAYRAWPRHGGHPARFFKSIWGWAPPPTPLPPPAPPVVDGRHKAGHDTRGTPARYFNAYRAWPGHPRLCPLQHRQSWMAGTRPAMIQGEHQPVISTHMRTCPGMTRTAVRDLHHSS